MLARTSVRRLRPCHTYFKRFATQRSTPGQYNPDKSYKRRQRSLSDTPAIVARTWNTSNFGMIDVFTIVRELERRYGKIARFETKRSHDIESDPLNIIVAVFEDTKSYNSIPPGHIIQVKCPNFGAASNEKVSLEHLLWAIDSNKRNKFLSGEMALPGEKNSELKTDGIPPTNHEGAPVEYVLLDVKLEHGFEAKQYLGDLNISKKRREELAEAIVSFGGFVTRSKEEQKLFAPRPMDAVIARWAKVLVKKNEEMSKETDTQDAQEDSREEEETKDDKPPLPENSSLAQAELLSKMETSPQAEHSQTTEGSPENQLSQPPPEEAQRFWFPENQTDSIQVTNEPIPPTPAPQVQEVAPDHAEQISPSKQTHESPKISKKERLLMAARKAGELAALRELQRREATSAPAVSPQRKDKAETLTLAKDTTSQDWKALGGTTSPNEQPPPEVHEHLKASEPGTAAHQPQELPRDDAVQDGTVHADREESLQSAKKWWKKLMG